MRLHLNTMSVNGWTYTIMNAGFGLMWEQLQGTQPFQSVVMSCTGHMAVVWLTKYRDIVQEHYQLCVDRLEGRATPD